MDGAQKREVEGVETGGGGVMQIIEVKWRNACLRLRSIPCAKPRIERSRLVEKSDWYLCFFTLRALSVYPFIVLNRN